MIIHTQDAASKNDPADGDRTGDPTVSCRGFCRACGREHLLHEQGARRYCLELMDWLRSRRSLDLSAAASAGDPRLSTDWLYSEAGGKMFGVLECLAPDRSVHILRAFSGQFNGLWDIDGWAPPLFDGRLMMEVGYATEKEIKRLGTEMAGPDCSAERKKALHTHRRQLSRHLMQRLHGLYRLTNFRGQSASIFSAYSGTNGIPTGTGDCCAPKLLNLAAVKGLRPLGLAEFFWGRSNRSGSREEGRFYPSCSEKCAPILGFMLCGLEEIHAGLST